MKKNYRNKILGMSVTAAMLLGSSAYAGKIIGVTAGTIWDHPSQQYGFGGWNLDNVAVNITSDSDFNDVIYPDIDGDMVNTNGIYPEMNETMSFESVIYNITQYDPILGNTRGTTVMGLLHGKDWPVGEPAGIKVVNDDTGTKKSGKSPNCIMTTSYLDEVDTGTGVSGYLDIFNEGGTPVPTVCSSPFQSHKRFKVNMQPAMVDGIAPGVDGAYGYPFELVFNLDTADTNATARRYQVFSKINNYTGVRLDGYKIELLDENGTKITDTNKINFSLDLTTKESSEDESGYEAVFAHGLWGPKDDPVRVPPHFEENGFFEEVRAGFVQEGNNTTELRGGTTTLGTLGSNYVDLFGIWLPSIWAPYGIFFDDDNDPTTDAELVAFWGTEPNALPDTEPTWHYGKDYDLSDGDQSWEEPTLEVLHNWMADPLYQVGKIEDTLNLGLNYVVEVGLNSTIGKTFTIRITPHIAPEANQTAPSYIDAQGEYIMPPTDYNGTVPILKISPSPYFNLGANLSVGIADTNVTDATDNAIDEVIVTLTASNGDEENLTLTETDVNSSIFMGTIGTDEENVGVQDGNINVVNGTVVTVSYKGLTATTTATDGTTVTKVTDSVLDPSSGGGGCTYNPNSKHFDMMFLVMMALGLLYPFRRRFLK